MPIQFKMVPKKNNLVSPPVIKYYPCAVSKGEIDLNDLAKIIAGRSTISKSDCYGVIMALSEIIGQSLLNGQIVKIASLGTFSLSLTGTPADSPEPLGKGNIKKAKVNYKPSKELKEYANKAEFKRIR